MKCDTKAKWVTRRKKGSGEPSKAPSKRLSWWYLLLGHLNPPHDIEEYETCGGNIVAQVQAVDEPYFGGASAALEVSYRCDRCGNTLFVELPSGPEEVSKLLTEAIATADGEILKDRVVADYERVNNVKLDRSKGLEKPKK